MVNVSRLIHPTFDLQKYFPDFTWNSSHELRVPDTGIVLFDPTYVADVYNSHASSASFLRTRGVFVDDFGGDISSPVWLVEPYLVMPISGHYESTPSLPTSAIELFPEIGCDSGSFVFLPCSNDWPADVVTAVQGLLENSNAARLHITPGLWTLKFEQFDAPQTNMVAMYRNIVLEFNP